MIFHGLGFEGFGFEGFEGFGFEGFEGFGFEGEHVFTKAATSKHTLMVNGTH